ncbi:hypothetical protein CCO04_00050 [Pimelobacter sp. 30-1]|nr:hypothetical protein [Pimelobacter sp. 30-1]
MQGMLPLALVQLMKAEDVAARYQASLSGFLNETIVTKTPSRDLTATSRWSSAPVREFLQLLDRADPKEIDPNTAQALARILRIRLGNPSSFDREWGQIGSESRRQLVDLAVKVRSRRPWVVLPVRTGWASGLFSSQGVLESALLEKLGTTFEGLAALSETLMGLGSRVQYLGPLRDEPRVVWNHWNELARGLPVGTRGEYSAAVLSRFGTSTTKHRDPDGIQREEMLVDAVNRWISYLEIGDNVAARSHGKLGVGFDLRVDGHIRDLTSVGVGVSQTLPLLVGVLASPDDSVFIVEQPELHLHPSVQARLADFMVTARPDLALIVETHSEAFITRIRRRAAEGLLDVNDVDITFVEPKAGGSFSRKLGISEFGDLSEWPRGFLSDSSEDLKAIITANLARTAGSLGER